MKRQPSSILKSPNNPSKTTIPIPPSLQGLHLGRRVSFGREQVHEFSIESTYSQENNCATVTQKTDATAQQSPSRISMGESMELTCIDNTREVYLVEPSVDVLYEKTRRPAHLSPQHNPSLQGLHSGRRVNFGREQFHEFSMENNCTAVTPKTDVTAQQSPSRISMGESMELTCIDNTREVYLVEPSMDILHEETVQPAHLSPQHNFNASSRMSWQSYKNYSENSLIDKVDESVQTTFNESPICLSKYKPTLLNISIPLPTRDKVDERRYKQYLEYRESIKRLRPIVAKKRARILELKSKKVDLERRCEEEEFVVNNLKEKLVTAKACLKEKRDAIQLDVMSRLQILQEKFIHVSNVYSKVQQELNK